MPGEQERWGVVDLHRPKNGEDALSFSPIKAVGGSESETYLPTQAIQPLVEALAWALDYIECEGRPFVDGSGFNAATEPENWSALFDGNDALSHFKALTEPKGGDDGG